jgi:hypothetical protein
VAHNLGIDIRSKDQPLPMEPKIERAFRDTARGVEPDLIQRERMDQLSRTWKTLSAQQR